MTKQEAIQAMREGKKITHRHFDEGYWIAIKNEKIVFKSKSTFPIDLYFSMREHPSWDDGYSIYAEK